MARTISIVGAGRVGKTLGKRLRKLGWCIGAVVTKSKATSGAAVQAIGAGLARSRVTIDAAAADVILVATPDDALAGVASALAEISGKDWRGKIVLHTSGTLDCGVLAPLARRGAATGSLHPMQTFSGRGVPNLAGVIFAVEGDPKARRVALGIVRALGGVPISIDSRDKPVYHAAAVLAAGSGFPLIESGVQMLMRIGFTRRRAMQTLLPLIRQMLDNIERIGPRAAWTGPLSRDDYTIIAKHAQALRGYPREVQQAYVTLAHLAAHVLSKKPASATKRLKRALAGR
ncbi:MAG: Rossmann-like and DUF2520 domain-containing protein [Candidatus Acidiferrales bacterium]|jgi:predicted short-subunit dehydrogenase-like oxidoreductase (DUF2520 family)